MSSLKKGRTVAGYFILVTRGLSWMQQTDEWIAHIPMCVCLSLEAAHSSMQDLLQASPSAAMPNAQLQAPERARTPLSHPTCPTVLPKKRPLLSLTSYIQWKCRKRYHTQRSEWSVRTMEQYFSTSTELQHRAAAQSSEQQHRAACHPSSSSCLTIAFFSPQMELTPNSCSSAARSSLSFSGASSASHLSTTQKPNQQHSRESNQRRAVGIPQMVPQRFAGAVWRRGALLLLTSTELTCVGCNCTHFDSCLYSW